jgi:hypothetical protein
MSSVSMSEKRSNSARFIYSPSQTAELAFRALISIVFPFACRTTVQATQKSPALLRLKRPHLANHAVDGRLLCTDLLNRLVGRCNRSRQLCALFA